MEVKPMLQKLGIAMASLCLVSTLAMAQPQTMVCTKVDPNGFCVEAKAPDEKMIVIKTEGVKIGEKMTCTTTGSSTMCTKVTTMQ
jgi:hypothetical protein